MDDANHMDDKSQHFDEKEESESEHSDDDDDDVEKEETGWRKVRQYE
jgi:hypothetical protein